MDLIVQRQLDAMGSGNSTYLKTFLNVARRAGADIRIVFAPWRSFGNRPWARFHPRFQAVTNEVVWPRSIKFGSYYWSLSPMVWSRFAIRLGKALLRQLGLDPLVYSYLYEPLSVEEAAIVAEVCNERTSDLTVAEYSSLGPVLKLLSGQTTKGVLLHDLLADRGARFRENASRLDFLEITREQEAEWVSAADICFYASANEMTAFRLFVPNAKSLWLRPELPTHQVRNQTERPRVVFLGTQHAGNDDALSHLINEIWPLIAKERPDTELWIVGSIGRNLSAAERRQSGVKVLGRVSQLSDIGGMNSIGVAPTRRATGVSIKVAEYLMLGMPSVVYPMALQGFGNVLNDLVEISKDPQTFAASVVRLIDEDALRLRRSNASIALTSKRLSNEEAVAYIRDLTTTGAVN